MLYLTLLAAAAATVSALAEPAVEVQLERRAPYAGGGFGIITPSDCPAGYHITEDVTLTLCCPNGFDNED
jgi:hypothetical protein